MPVVRNLRHDPRTEGKARLVLQLPVRNDQVIIVFRLDRQVEDHAQGAVPSSGSIR